MNVKPIQILLFIVVLFNGSFQIAAQPDEAWETIFNGKNLDGWSIVDPHVKAIVEDSSILIHMMPHTSRHSFIRTNRQFEDFIFEIDFKRDKLMDSGVMFRCESTPDSAFSALFGYMIKIDTRPERLWTGGLFVDYGNGYSWIQTLENNEAARKAENEEGEWNRLRVEAIGDEIKVWLNEIPTVHVSDNRYKIGYIGLKIHYLNNNKEENTGLIIAYRNVRIVTENVS